MNPFINDRFEGFKLSKAMSVMNSFVSDGFEGIQALLVDLLRRMSKSHVYVLPAAATSTLDLRRPQV